MWKIFSLGKGLILTEPPSPVNGKCVPFAHLGNSPAQTFPESPLEIQDEFTSHFNSIKMNILHEAAGGIELAPNLLTFVLVLRYYYGHPPRSS
jgi:hypothetical protein